MANAHPDQTIDYLKSRLDILDCINRYPRIVDRFDRDALYEVFHEDAVLDYAVLVGTPAEFMDYFHALHREHHSYTAHMVYNHLCEIDGDEAYTETYFAVANNNLHGPPDFTLAGGRYVDQFERRGGRWAIARRKCIGEWDASGGSELVDKLRALFVNVGTTSRDRTDVAYERPVRIAPERIGTRIAI